MEAYDKLVKLFGDEALSGAQVCRWHTIFKYGDENVGDDPKTEDQRRRDREIQKLKR